MRKILSLLLSAALLLGCFAGCAAEDTPYLPSGDALAEEDADVNATEALGSGTSQELSLGYYADRSMNPFQSTDFTNRVLFSLIYQGLFAVSSSNEAVPILCDQYQVSQDSRTYTVFLNTEATFSDGTAVTVSDVLASYETAMASKYYKNRFTHVREVKAGSSTSVIFYLLNPIEDLPLLLDIPIVKASEVSEDAPLGSGPYILDSGIGGAQLRRNSAWWCQDQATNLAVTAENIPLVPCSSTTQLRDEFEFADVGLVLADPCTDSYADFRCDYELWDCENGIFLYLGCNVAYRDIFKDSSLRSILTYAIDRKTIAQENYNGYAQPTTLACSPRSELYYSASLAEKYEYDPVKFIQAMNYVKKPKEALELLVNLDDSLRLRTARDIAEMLTDCGLEVVTKEVSTKQYQSLILAGNYDFYLGQTRLSANMDLSPFFHPWGEISWGGLSNAELYDLCLDALENQGNYYNLHKAVADDGRIVPILFCSYAVYATRGLLTELQPARDNVFYYTLGRRDADALIPIDYSSDGASG